MLALAAWYEAHCSSLSNREGGKHQCWMLRSSHTPTFNSVRILLLEPRGMRGVERGADVHISTRRYINFYIPDTSIRRQVPGGNGWYDGSARWSAVDEAKFSEGAQCLANVHGSPAPLPTKQTKLMPSQCDCVAANCVASYSLHGKHVDGKRCRVRCLRTAGFAPEGSGGTKMSGGF